jgi:hypothetical protein
MLSQFGGICFLWFGYAYWNAWLTGEEKLYRGFHGLMVKNYPQLYSLVVSSFLIFSYPCGYV